MTTQTDAAHGGAVNPGQWPPEVEHLPVCPHRKLPIPFIAEVGADGTGHFTILDNDRALACLKHRLCAMCGLPMGAEIALLGDVASLEPGGFWIEPPVHERCAEIAAGGLCPFVSRERVPRRPPEDGVAIVGMGPLVLYVTSDSTCWPAPDPPGFRGNQCRRVLTPLADNHTWPFLAGAESAVRRSVSRWSARRRSLWPNDLDTRRRTATIAAPRKGPHPASGSSSRRQSTAC